MTQNQNAAADNKSNASKPATGMTIAGLEVPEQLRTTLQKVGTVFAAANYAKLALQVLGFLPKETDQIQKSLKEVLDTQKTILEEVKKSEKRVLSAIEDVKTEVKFAAHRAVITKEITSFTGMLNKFPELMTKYDDALKSAGNEKDALTAVKESDYYRELARSIREMATRQEFDGYLTSDLFGEDLFGSLRPAQKFSFMVAFRRAAMCRWTVKALNAAMSDDPAWAANATRTYDEFQATVWGKDHSARQYWSLACSRADGNISYWTTAPGDAGFSGLEFNEQMKSFDAFVQLCGAEKEDGTFEVVEDAATAWSTEAMYVSGKPHAIRFALYRLLKSATDDKHVKACRDALLAKSFANQHENNMLETVLRIADGGVHKCQVYFANTPRTVESHGDDSMFVVQVAHYTDDKIALLCRMRRGVKENDNNPSVVTEQLTKFDVRYHPAKGGFTISMLVNHEHGRKGTNMKHRTDTERFYVVHQPTEGKTETALGLQRDNTAPDRLADPPENYLFYMLVAEGGHGNPRRDDLPGGPGYHTLLASNRGSGFIFERHSGWSGGYTQWMVTLEPYNNGTTMNDHLSFNWRFASVN